IGKEGQASVGEAARDGTGPVRLGLVRARVLGCSVCGGCVTGPPNNPSAIEHGQQVGGTAGDARPQAGARTSEGAGNRRNRESLGRTRAAGSNAKSSQAVEQLRGTG